MTFNEQAALEVVKGLFTVLALLAGGGVVGRAIEKFKTSQAISIDLRKRQYDALGEVLAAIGKTEAAYLVLHHTKATHLDALERNEKFNSFVATHIAAADTLSAARYLIGEKNAKAATEVLNFLVELVEDEKFRTTELIPPLNHPEYDAKLDDLRRPLMALLPQLRPEAEAAN